MGWEPDSDSGWKPESSSWESEDSDSWRADYYGDDLERRIDGWYESVCIDLHELNSLVREGDAIALQESHIRVYEQLCGLEALMDFYIETFDDSERMEECREEVMERRETLRSELITVYSRGVQGFSPDPKKLPPSIQ